MAEKHLVCLGATVYCSQSVIFNSPAMTVPLIITSQTLVSANGGKLCATNKDNTVANMNFGLCNTPSTVKPPCAAMVTWSKVHEEIDVTTAAFKFLTEQSEGRCMACGVPGTIKIAYHGQITTVLPETMESSSEEIMEAINPLASSKNELDRIIELN